ncbi:MAG: hypothetical protein ABEJ42_00685 [Halobacteriaceae archaeon]
MSELTDRLRARYSVPRVVGWLVVVGVLFAATRNAGVVGGVAVALAVGEAAHQARVDPRVPDRWADALVGVVVTVGSLAWLGYERTVAAGRGGPAWFPAVTAVAGAWFIGRAMRHARGS